MPPVLRGRRLTSPPEMPAQEIAFKLMQHVLRRSLRQGKIGKPRLRCGPSRGGEAGKAPPLQLSNVPPIRDRPAATDLIQVENGRVQMPD